MNWKDMEDGDEKRHAYYCSPEWGIIKIRIAGRSQGVCEICRLRPARLVHHLTYIRLYNERPEDLQHVCRECNKVLHPEHYPTSEGSTAMLPTIQTNSVTTNNTKKRTRRKDLPKPQRTNLDYFWALVQVLKPGEWVNHDKVYREVMALLNVTPQDVQEFRRIRSQISSGLTALRSMEFVVGKARLGTGVKVSVKIAELQKRPDDFIKELGEVWNGGWKDKGADPSHLDVSGSVKTEYRILYEPLKGFLQKHGLLDAVKSAPKAASSKPAKQEKFAIVSVNDPNDIFTAELKNRIASGRIPISKVSDDALLKLI